MADDEMSTSAPTEPAVMSKSRQTVKLAHWLGMLVVLACLGALFPLQRYLDRTRGKVGLAGADELMYFPSGKLLNQIAGEYKGIVADYGWLRVVQYYAYHMVRDQNYEWLGHIVRIVGQLDPKFKEAYRFGSLILTWDAEQTQEGIDLLRDGMQNNQLTWELPFQAGFNAYEKAKDYSLAAHYFKIAAELPGVWRIVPRWAAIASARSGNLELAREIWTEIWRFDPNEKLRKVARRQLNELLREELTVLQAAVDSFVKLRQRPPETLTALVEAGLLEQALTEPFGGRFMLRNGRVVSTTVETMKGLQARLQILVDQFRAEHGRPPEALDDLVGAGYLTGLPTDPMGGVLVLKSGRVETELTLP